MSIDFNDYNTKTISSVAKDAEAFAIRDLFYRTDRDLLCILSDGVSLTQVHTLLKVIDPEIEVLLFPAWDTVPYDRVSPNPHILSQRIDTLSKLTLESEEKKHRIILSSIGAVIQKLPPKKIFINTRKLLKVGETLNFDNFLHYAVINGYTRVEQVMEAGEYAVRGDIIDIFPSGAERPIRIDLFDDEIERLRYFEVETQRSTGDIQFYNFDSANEVILDQNTIKTFRSKYREAFGAAGLKDELYESVSNGKKYLGMENWLPFFYDDALPTIFDYIPQADVIIGIDASNALKAKLEAIEDHYQSRLEALKINNPMAEVDAYRPITTDLLFLEEKEFIAGVHGKRYCSLTHCLKPKMSLILELNRRKFLHRLKTLIIFLFMKI